MQVRSALAFTTCRSISAKHLPDVGVPLYGFRLVPVIVSSSFVIWSSVSIGTVLTVLCRGTQVVERGMAETHLSALFTTA